MIDPDIIQQLKTQGHKITKTRLAVIQLLNTNSPLSALEILGQLAQGGLKVNKTTIYRELEYLKAHQLVNEVMLDNIKHFELDQDHHHHAVCTSCNSIEHISIPENLEAVRLKLEKQHNFELQNHIAEFFGLCSKCR